MKQKINIDSKALNKASKKALKAVALKHYKGTGETKSGGDLLREAVGIKEPSFKQWRQEDVWAGRIVCKPPFGPDGAKDLWFAKWAHKIGWLSYESEDDRKYAVIAVLSDGMIYSKQSKKEIADWLNTEKMVPMKEEWLLEALTAVRGTLGITLSLEQAYQKVLGGAIAISPFLYAAALNKIAELTGRKNDDSLKSDVAKIGLSMPEYVD